MIMKTLITKIFLASLAVASFCACEKEDSLASSVSTRPIIPSVNGIETKALDAAALSALESNGFQMDIIAAQDYIDHTKNPNNQSAGKYGDTRTVTKSSGSWALDVPAYWINDVQLDFWAYNMTAATTCDITTPNAGASTLSFTYPKAGHTPDGKSDILFAHTSDTHDRNSHSSEGDMINLTFHHAMAKIRFAVNIDDDTFDGGVYGIKDISIEGAKDCGACTYDPASGYAWSSQSISSPAKTFTNTYNAVFSPSVSSGWTKVGDNWVANDCFLLIPQGSDGITVTITFTKGGADQAPVSVSLPSGDTFEAGKYYTYKIVSSNGKENLEPLTIIEDFVSDSDWDGPSGS